MLRSLGCLAVVFGLSSLAGAAERSAEKSEKKASDASPQEAVKKVEAAKDAATPSWIPKQFHGTPMAAQLLKLQAEIDAANAKRGPAREEADKARHAAHQAEHKADLLNQQIKSLELEKQRVMENGQKHLREFSLDKADIENAQKVARLEAQVRELTARLDAATRPQAAKPHAAKPADKPHADKPVAPKASSDKPADKPAAEKPAAPKPSADKPAADKAPTK